MLNTYYRLIVMSEKLHRLFLDALKEELQRMNIKDINSVQSLILYNMGTNEVNVGDLTERGYYLGSNVSYNLRKLVENGYVLQSPSYHDRRQSNISITDKGKELQEELNKILSSHTSLISNHYSIPEEELKAIENSFNILEKFLNERRIKKIR